MKQCNAPHLGNRKHLHQLSGDHYLGASISERFGDAFAYPAEPRNQSCLAVRSRSILNSPSILLTNFIFRSKGRYQLAALGADQNSVSLCFVALLMHQHQ